MATATVTRAWPTLLAVALQLAGCSATAGDADADYAATVVLASRGEVAELVRWNEGRNLLFLPLLEADERGEVGGRLARSWENTADGREWTFYLRSDVRWHDGTPVTAKDVKFTLDLLSHPDVTEFTPGDFDVEVRDDTTVVVRTATTWTGRTWTWPVALPEHLLRDLDRKAFASWPFWHAPVGNGAYRFVRAVPSTLLELEANPEHYEGEPAIRRVILKLVGGAGARELLAGKADIMQAVPAGEAMKLVRDGRFELYPWFNEGLNHAVYWRNDHPLFADARVRRALTLAIDRPGLLRLLNLPEDAPIPDALYSERQFRRGELPEPLPHDAAAAARLLAEAGWRDTDGDGVLDRDGRAFRFELIMPPDYYGTRQAAVYIVDQLQRAGIRVELRPQTDGLLARRLRSGDYEAAIGTVAMGTLHDVVGQQSRARYANARMTELIDRALGTADTAEQDRLFQEMTAIFRADLPVTPLFPFTITTAAHRRVRGLSSPHRTNASHIMAELWLEPQSAR